MGWNKCVYLNKQTIGTKRLPDLSYAVCRLNVNLFRVSDCTRKSHSMAEANRLKQSLSSFVKKRRMSGKDWANIELN